MYIYLNGYICDSCHQIFHIKTEFFFALQVTEQSAKMIEKETRRQARDSKWFEHREWRIGASRQGDVCHSTGRRDMRKLCRNIFSPPQLHTAAVLHGQAYEEDAIKKFAKETSLSVEKCGLFVSVKYPYLAATPDGLVGNSHVLEIKCPYSGRDQLIEPGKCFPFLCYNDGRLSLKKNHKYYDQVQAQMAITGRKCCYFAVFTFVDFKYIELNFDCEYWEESMIPKLTLFYEKYFRSFVASQM